ncbi:hypothetical protein NST14_02015 [Bacillus sp. FSL W8-0519]|uniref:hypothetical protein n=1 Tax=Bacillus TaxID=1386 RepID=UPI001E293D3F|nr:hypothetical protein [Bacillus paranthracis]MBL3756931.1 hypothetical protein [Bacillus cereus]MCC2412273.1 hypothetical protein [Bacillus paranthracis]
MKDEMQELVRKRLTGITEEEFLTTAINLTNELVEKVDWKLLEKNPKSVKNRLLILVLTQFSTM